MESIRQEPDWWGCHGKHKKCPGAQFWFSWRVWKILTGWCTPTDTSFIFLSMRFGWKIGYCLSIWCSLRVKNVHCTVSQNRAECELKEFSSHNLAIRFEPFWFNTPANSWFFIVSGAELSSEPQIGIFDFQLFGLQVFAPIDFSAENQKSLRRFGIRPSPARNSKNQSRASTFSSKRESRCLEAKTTLTACY